MRTAQELSQQIEALASDYAALIDGVQEDGAIDMDEAVLGREYAEEYRAQLQALIRETREIIRQLRASFRVSMREARAAAASTGRGQEQATLLEERQVALVHPYYEVLLRLDKLVTEARLSKAIFHAAQERLRESGAANVLIPRLIEISAATVEEADEEPTGVRAQQVLQADAVGDTAQMQREALADAAGRWQALLSEVNDRLSLNIHPEQASHLRGIRKALLMVLQDAEMMLRQEQA
jgi:hypothetical protein